MPRSRGKWTIQNEKDKKWLYNAIKKSKDTNQSTGLFDSPFGEQKKTTKKGKKAKNTIIEPLDYDTFIIDLGPEEIESFINNSTWAIGSREKMFFMVSRVYGEDGDKETAKHFRQLGWNLKEENEMNEENNQLDEKENKSYRDHTVFLNMLESHKFSDYETIDQHYQYLLLYILVHQPPLRTDFYSTARLTTDGGENDGKSNYVYVVRKRGEYGGKYIVNKDKVSTTRSYESRPELSYIPLVANVAKELYESLVKYPRTYLFENPRTHKPTTAPTLLNYLKRITGIEGLTFNLMRASFVTFYYKNNHTLREKTVLSTSMRHSVTTASRNYNKIFQPDKPIERDDEMAQLQKSILYQDQEIEELKRKILAYDDDSEKRKKYKKKQRVYYIQQIQKR